MENSINKESIETFESVIQGLTNFINKVLNLSESYTDIFYDYIKDCLIIESRVQKYLNNPQNFKTLQHYINVLKRVTDKNIKEAIPNGIIDADDVLFSVNSEEIIRQEIREQIDRAISHISGILDRHKILSIKNKYFDNPDEPKIKHSKLSAFETELIKGQLIKRTLYFSDIFRGKAPNEKINWIGGASNFRYFINALFNTDLFKDEKQRWIIAVNTFVINGNPIPDNIRTYKEKDVNPKTKLIINDAISYLID